MDEKSVSWVREVPDIDLDQGLANCDGETAYLAILKVFHFTIPEKSDELEELYRKEDWENYAIKVHGLKSSARVIGAGELFERAKEMEFAAKDGNIALVREKTEGLLTYYRTFQEKLSPAEDLEKERPEADAQTLQDAYQTLAEAADFMDEDLAEMVLNEMEEYRLPKEDDNVFRELRRSFLNADWEQMRSALCKKRSL